MTHFPNVAGTLAIGIIALAAPALAEGPRYPSPAQMKLVRTATLYLTADGAFANLDPVEWCEEVEGFLRERGYKQVHQQHRQVLHEVVVSLPASAVRTSAQEVVRLVGGAPAPLSRFRARFEIRRFDNTMVTARFDGEQWKEARESLPDPLPFTLDLSPGQWMMSVEQSRDRTTRISLWDKVGEANPFDVQALVALPNGTVHRSRVIPWNPAGVEVFLTGVDFPTLQGKKLAHGTYRVIFEADGKTIEWPRSLPFEL
jgi:hypothetical protein